MGRLALAVAEILLATTIVVTDIFTINSHEVGARDRTNNVGE